MSILFRQNVIINRCASEIYVDLLWLYKHNMRKLCHQQVNWANNLRQLYCHLRQTVQYLHNLFTCLEMTPAALKCQLIAVELCNLETTVFFNPLSFSMAHPWCVVANGTLKEDWCDLYQKASWKCAFFVWKCDDKVDHWINQLLLWIWW